MKIQVHKTEIRLNLQDLETDLPHTIHWCALTSERSGIWYCTNPQGELPTQTCKMKIALKFESNFLRTKILPHFEYFGTLQYC